MPAAADTISDVRGCPQKCTYPERAARVYACTRTHARTRTHASETHRVLGTCLVRLSSGRTHCTPRPSRDGCIDAQGRRSAPRCAEPSGRYGAVQELAVL